MNNRVLLALRCVLASVWLYNGLVLKLWLLDPEHVQVMEAVGGFGPFSPVTLLQMIGAAETLLAVGILSGIAYRGLAWFQLALVMAMNLVGVASGGVQDGAKLLMTNLPLLMCMLIAARTGPGSWSQRDR